ncbi:MAG: C/D box methylation guide ribonucleoprotein complex aNOP56 subunit, partial [Candidatus Micrarchaeota archaeon]|nr:C/D box methylation guide ribonucleoprotein complex aNOP56 subunit [Candidatus Micrarchaeota archaeon]
MGEPKALEIKAQKEKSFGAPLEADDAKALKDMATAYDALCQTRTHLEKYIETISRQIMPNATALVGALVSARLLSIAGSLQRLANFPASTLQVLGAEKALFKHLRKHTLPPKHGVIFQVPYVNAQPFDKRGKAARALAGKLAIALKADFYSKHDISKKLLADLYKREEQINALPTRNIQPKDYRERDYQ